MTTTTGERNAVVRGDHERLLKSYRDTKTTDDIDLLPGAEDGLHHFADMLEPPFEDETFDVIVSDETTMYADPHDLFRRFARLLRPGGRRGVVTWCRDDSVDARSSASRRIEDHYRFRMHKRSAYFEALAVGGLAPCRVTRHTDEAIPSGELRDHSRLLTGIEAAFLEGYREKSLDHLVIACERVR